MSAQNGSRKKILFIVEAMGGGIFTYIVDLANELCKKYDTKVMAEKYSEIYLHALNNQMGKGPARRHCIIYEFAVHLNESEVPVLHWA